MLTSVIVAKAVIPKNRTFISNNIMNNKILKARAVVFIFTLINKRAMMKIMNNHCRETIKEVYKSEKAN